MQISKGIEFIRNPYLKTTESTEWADLGCGSGFFTGILWGLLKEGSMIHAVDRDEGALAHVRDAVGGAIGKVAGTATGEESGRAGASARRDHI